MVLAFLVPRLRFGQVLAKKGREKRLDCPTATICAWSRQIRGSATGHMDIREARVSFDCSL